jgi:ribulose kinase
MKLKWFSRPQKNIVTESHKEFVLQSKLEEEFAEKLDLIEKKYADRLDRKEKEILERLGHVDKELAKTLGFVETEYLRLRKFQDKLNTCMESHKELQSDNAVLRATINDLQSKLEEEFAEKLDLIEKKYADRLNRREREILERLDHVDNELAKRLGFVETESAVRLGKFQAKLNACNTRLSNAESCISTLKEL